MRYLTLGLRWCDPSSYMISGWDQLVNMYSNYSLPLFMSEYGCITNTRTFQETKALYGTNMTKVFSGGLVYEYSEEGNGYGLVTINGDTVAEVGSQFTDLQSALASVNDPQDGGGYSTNGVIQTCPEQSDDWDTSPFIGTALPAMPTAAEKYMQKGAGKGPGILRSCRALSHYDALADICFTGLSGAGSQNDGSGSSSTASANAGAVTTTYGSDTITATASSTGAKSSPSKSAASMSIASTDYTLLTSCIIIFGTIIFEIY
jgi:hypothetical protein